MGNIIGRRTILSASAATSLLRAADAQAAPQSGDPRHSATGQIKLSGTLDGTPAYWVYNGVIYSVQPGTHPLPMVAITGCDSVWAEQRTDGSWRVTGVLLTFFRDLQSGAFLDHFTNPVTGRLCTVQPNYLHGGAMIYPADGGSAVAEGQIAPSVIAPGGFKASDPSRKLGRMRWNVLNGAIMLSTDRSWNVAVQPQLEAQTQTGDAALFFNPKIQRMPATVATTTIMPWITWMEMGSTPGHLVWHVAGEKLFDPGEIPADYRARAGAMLPVLLARP